MKYPKRIFRNYLLPLMILAPMISLMVGCLYFNPKLGHTQLVGTKADFRSWEGDHAHAKPRELTSINQTAIEGMFGKPAFASRNGRCVAYVMTSEDSIVTRTLCFSAAYANGQTYIMKLVYNDRGEVKKVISLAPDNDGRPIYWVGGMLDAEPDIDLIPGGFTGAELFLGQLNHSCFRDEVIEDLGFFGYPPLLAKGLAK